MCRGVLHRCVRAEVTPRAGFPSHPFGDWRGAGPARADRGHERPTSSPSVQRTRSFCQSPAARFYCEFVGLAVTQRSYPGALFFSAGAYHHHLAVNTWAGDQPPPGNSIGLISYRLEVPEAEILYCLRHRAPLAGYEATTEIGETGSELLQIRDPNGHWLEVQHGSSRRLTPFDRKRSQSLTRNRTMKPTVE